MHAKWVEIISEITLQLRDPKNDFIFNFNDKMKIFEQFEVRTK